MDARGVVIVQEFIAALWHSATRPAIFRRCVSIAAAVGTLLTLVNQGDVILAGAFTPKLAWRVLLNYLVPFVVSNLGAMSPPPPPVRPDWT